MRLEKLLLMALCSHVQWVMICYFSARRNLGDGFWYEIKSLKEFSWNSRIIWSNFSSEMEVSLWID